ncbi:MAG: phosphoribosyltransferase [Actinomycetota bacterium]|nr:phosphoribosyltransferase [Actinomycetota bacterium]
MIRWPDRRHAGEALSDELAHLEDGEPLVLAIPRGGVEVAAVVANRLDGELDVIIARKLGAPWNQELAIGAVTADGVPVLDQELVRRLGVSEAHVEAEIARQAAEVQRREEAYRAGRPAIDPRGRTVVVVDDGVATGATARAALGYVRRRGPRRLVFAVPVGPPDTIASLADEADEVVCPSQPARFYAVGEWYDDFRQVSDQEVIEMLARSGSSGD